MADHNNIYYHYYVSQMGHGASPYYHSLYRVQAGRGFGSFLAKAWGFLKPLFGYAARQVGQEGIHAAGQVLRDSLHQPEVPVKQLIKQRGKEALANLADKASAALKGRGRGRPRRRVAGRVRASRRGGRRGGRRASGRARQLVSGGRKGRIRHPSQVAIKDIFSPPS